uniref:FYVE-type domain-containing protein n=1 Tax=Scylla olivacea TaxID=85551 RepID=A0A0N7ZB20_SCYOL
MSEAVGVQSPNSPTMAPVGEDDPQGIPDSALAMQEASSEVAVLNQRLTSLERDNDMLRASCSALQSQLDQVKSTDAVVPSIAMGENSHVISSVHDRCQQCELLIEELRVTKSQNEDLENLRCQLEEQVCALQLQQDKFETQEKDLNSEIKCLQEKLNEAHITSRTLDSCVSGVTETDIAPDLPIVTVVPEQTQVPDSDRLESHIATDSTISAQESLEQCQSRLRELEKENKLLQEQCNAAEVEKTMLRTNIRKISEVEEELKQKVASLNQQEHEYECLQEEVDTLKEQLEERGHLLHIASSRVTELEATLKAHEKSSEETHNYLKQAEEQVKELQTTHSKQNQEHEQLKREMETLHVQLADLRFQVSSKDMECDAAIKADQEKMEALTAASLQINEQEARINHLEQQATADTKAWQNEVESLSSIVTKLQEDIKERNIHCSSIEERLLQAEAKVKMTQNTLTETQGELKTTQDNSTQLSSDNEQLREKILQLLREKDALWQANMRLEAAAGGNRTWMDNSSAQKCLGCSVSFSLTRRRHHCRTCGRIFCTGCSDNWIMTPASSKRVRVCDDCFSIQAELAAIVATVASTTSSWHGSDESSEQSATGVQASSSARSLPITNRQPNDDDYAVISDDEVQSSRLSSSPSSGSPPSNPEVVPETRATADILTFSSLSSQPPTDFEAWVGAGTRSLVPVELPAGVTLQWNFISEPKCISFSVLHQPPPLNNQEPGDEGVSVSQRVLIPTTRVASTQGSSVRGRLVTKQPGVYTLVFDNASSRYIAKKITYSLRLLKQAGEDSLSQHPSPPSVSHPSP